MAHQEIIIIDDNDDDTYAPRPRRKASASKPAAVDTSNGSDIEIIEDPVELESLSKLKGKGKRKVPSSAQSSPKKKRPRRVSRDEDEAEAQMNADAEMARRMAMEWEEEVIPEPNGQPQAGPSTQSQPSSSHASTSHSTKEIIEIASTAPSRASTQDRVIKEVVEVLSSGVSRATTIDSDHDLSRPVAPSASKIPAQILDIPYFHLPNPQLKLQEFKDLLTSNRECSECREFVDASNGQVPELEGTGITESALRTLLHLECPNDTCPAVHCRGCFKHVFCLSRCKKAKRSSADTCEVFKCCAEARAIALFEALSAFDKRYLVDKALAESRAQEMKKQAKKNTSSTVGPGGTGYSTGAHQHFAAFGGGEVWYDDEDDEDEFTDEEFDDMMDDFMDEMEEELFEHNQAVWAAKYKELQTKVEALKKAKLGNTGKPKGPSSFGMMDLNGSQPGPARTKQPQAPPPPVVEELSEADKALIDALTLLTELLPAPYGAEPAIYDLLPHSSLGALILMSHVPTVLAQLLRNDSVTDWIARSRVYHAMLGLLKRLADCELTIPTLVGHRPEFSKHPGIGALMRGQGEFCWQRNEKGEVEMAVPLLEHFKKLKRQAETFLHSTQTQLGGGDGDQEVVEGLSLCADIVGAQDDIRKAMAALHQYNSRTPDTEDEGNGKEDVQATYGPAPSSNTPAELSLGRGKRTKKAAVPRAAALTTTAEKGKEKATASAENGFHASSFDLEKEYIAACEKLSFDYVTLGSEGLGSSGLVYKTYNFATLLQQTQNSTRIPRNRIHFAKELAVMATSLPPGIWVRVDEVRNDAIKVMIAGPQGTPYAGGLFEFDCFIPLEYPNTPPKMHLRTTGGGTVRFNPNLYNCGKVCLSLLGTWSGSPEEQWTSKSTLLQVLVSIQSMILNEAPYYNEPGHGKANLKAAASIDYNRNTSLQTVRWAIVDWFKEEHMNGIWKDVIKSHFSLRKDKIQQQIAVWAKEDPRMKAYHASLRGHGHALPPGIHGAIGGHPFGNLRLPPAPTPPPASTMDLVAEFEQGMRRVEAGPSEG